MAEIGRGSAGQPVSVTGGARRCRPGSWQACLRAAIGFALLLDEVKVRLFACWICSARIEPWSAVTDLPDKAASVRIAGF